MTRTPLLIFALLLGACGDDTAPADGGPSFDAGLDATATDGGLNFDSGPPLRWRT